MKAAPKAVKEFIDGILEKFKKQEVTEVYYNAKDPTAEIYTHDTKLKSC